MPKFAKLGFSYQMLFNYMVPCQSAILFNVTYQQQDAVFVAHEAEDQVAASGHAALSQTRPTHRKRKRVEVLQPILCAHRRI
jgi:hypothetical protein